MVKKKKETPHKGFKGLKHHWRNDMVAAVSVALVALPLSLAIAVAVGLPPISGLMTSVVAGLFVTFFRGGEVSINGPAAGMIGVLISGLAALDDGTGTLQAFRYLLAATVVAGALQVIIGVFRWGRVAELFPTTVIQGILASIGIIIFAKQVHVGMGTSSEAENTIGILIDIFYKIPEINPYIAIICSMGVLLMIFHDKINYRLFHIIPAPVWALVVAVPIVLFYDYLEINNIEIFGSIFEQPKDYLISIPNDLTQSFVFPDFSKAYTLTFWMVVISINLIASVITLASAKAVDKLDPYNRKTNMNKEMVGVGIGSIISGFVGGLPVLTVIVRSTVNVHNLAKTRWSNFFHALIIFILVVLLTPVIQLFPKAALAAVLIITGVKLASPRIFKETYRQGLEQLIFLITTIIITLYRDPLQGLVGGILTTLIAHILIARVNVTTFFQKIFRTGTVMRKNEEDNVYVLEVNGIANFLSLLKLINLLEKIPPKAVVQVDLSKTRLIDFTYQEKLMEFRRLQRLSGGKVQIIGLDEHVASSNHALALKSLILPNYKKTTARERRIKNIAKDKGWLYTRLEQVDSTELLEFNFFQMRPIESKFNVIGANFESREADWEISDIVFDEGAMLSKEVYKTTIQLIHLPSEIPSFIIDKEGFVDKFFDRILSLSRHKDIDFDFAPNFSRNIKLTGENEEEIRVIFNEKMIHFLESEEIYHIESNGSALLIFKSLKLANTPEMKNMLRFSNEFVSIILENTVALNSLREKKQSKVKNNKNN